MILATITSLLISLFQSTVPGTLNYDVVGNSLGINSKFTSTDSTQLDNHKYVQTNVNNIWVSKNGTVNAYSGLDFGGHDIGFYKSGDNTGFFTFKVAGVDNGGITGDDLGHLFVTSNVYNSSFDIDGFGVLRLTESGNYSTFATGVGYNSSFFKLRSDSLNDSIKCPSRLTVDKNAHELYVLDPFNNVYVLDLTTNSQTPKAKFTLTSVKDLVSDNAGNLIIIQNDTVRRISNRGVFQKNFLGFKKPSRLHYSRQNELYVWDDTAYRITILRNLSSTNPTKRFLGTDSGIISSNGSVSTSTALLPYVTGIGTDSTGKIYISWGKSTKNASPSSTDIRSYNLNFSLLWSLYNHSNNKLFGFDESSDGKTLYSSENKYIIDYTKALNSKVTYSIFNWRESLEPTQPSLDNTVFVKTLNSKKIIAKTISTDTSNYFKYYVEKNNFLDSASTINLYNSYAYFWDNNGDIWYVNSGLNKISYTGLTNGKPTWNTSSPTNYLAYTPSMYIKRIQYNTSTKDMLFTGNYSTSKGNTTKNSNGDKGVGENLIMYSNYPTSPSIRWSITIPLDTLTNKTIWSASSISMTGSYIFVKYVSSLNVYVYQVSNGSYVGYISPDKTQAGYIQPSVLADKTYNLQTFKRANNSYVILISSNENLYNLMYVWCPSGSCANN